MTTQELIAQIKDLNLKSNFTSIKFTVQTYQLLKQARTEKRIDDSFFDIYRSFYAMRSSKPFNDTYFKLLKEDHDEKKISLNYVVNKLKNADQGKEGKGPIRFQFSYMTKLLSILNDKEYPIYDSMVAKVFGYKNDIAPQEIQEYGIKVNDKDIIKQEVLINRYENIQHIYKEAIPEITIELETFKSLFDCKELENMRVIDILVWQIGKIKIKEEEDKKNPKSNG